MLMNYKQLEILLKIYGLTLYDSDLYKVPSISALKYIFTELLNCEWKEIQSEHSVNSFGITAIEIKNKKRSWLILHKKAAFTILYLNLNYDMYNIKEKNTYLQYKNENILSYILSSLTETLK